MPYLSQRSIQRPYMPYIQRGGGLMNFLGNMAFRYAVPYLTRAAKTAQSGATEAIKSKATKNIISSAKKAIHEGINDATGKILDGHNIGEVIKSTAQNTKGSITNQIQKEAKKVGQNLRKRKQANLISPPPKKRKAAKKLTRKSKSKSLLANNPLL